MVVVRYPAYHAVDTVTLRFPTGEGALGPTWSAPVDVQCRRRDGSKLMRDVNGDEVVSTTTLEVPASVEYPEHLAAAGGTVDLGDRVTHVVSVEEQRRRGQLVYTTINLA